MMRRRMSTPSETKSPDQPLAAVRSPRSQHPPESSAAASGEAARAGAFRRRALAPERLSEGDAVRLLNARFSDAAALEALDVGIGDDAAVLAKSGLPWVVSVDTSVEGVHFAYDYLSLEDVGYRAFQAALSDLAAMGAKPRAALSSLILPRDFDRHRLAQLSAGLALASREGGCPIVGGNLARGRELSVTTTVLGHAERPLLRSGARPGDELWLVGPIGLAAAGLALLRSPRRADEGAGAERCIAAWRRPRALLDEGLRLASCATAGVDVSDGLAAEAAHISRASGVSVHVERERLRKALHPSLIAAARRLRRSALTLAIRGGEDYALLATGPRRQRPPEAAVIGHVTQGQGAWLVHGADRRPLFGGYDHLASRGGRRA